MVFVLPMDLSEYLKSFSSQAEAAQILKVSQGTISHWITGRRRPAPSKALELVRLSKGKLSMERIYGARR